MGETQLPCAVLDDPDRTRVLSERGVLSVLGVTRSGGRLKSAVLEAGGGRLPLFLADKNLRPYIDNDLTVVLAKPILYRQMTGGRANHGLAAALIPKVCDVWLRARDAGVLSRAQLLIAQKADILMRGLAHVGIVALVDEATGFQADRARDALAKILEAFVQKELRKWVSTFPPSYYEQLCRLRGVEYPPEKMRLPQYFGGLTNNIVYERLAPGVKDELKRIEAERRADGKRRARLHQHLTDKVGVPKLAEHLSAVTALMKIAPDYDTFEGHLNNALPKWEANLAFDFKE